MTIEPGYYWIRWPDDEDDSYQRWQPCRIEQCLDMDMVIHIAYIIDDYDEEGGLSLDGAELGPRIEPPRDEK